MQTKTTDTSDASRIRKLALSQWDSEGGAGPCGGQEGTCAPPVGTVEISRIPYQAVLAIASFLFSLLLGRGC